MWGVQFWNNLFERLIKIQDKKTMQVRLIMHIERVK
ncbi:hypothetical protein SAMN05216333_1024 [Nitrosomonas oligotropha]|uniref:Uncharacterized protein n=1 Tax=Nitrosomonas oligotropha TaxID=42354 RepID=A0A1H8K5A6_9PROT|nr:hypothetical protein SAMN05216300_1034 [Nitrosomonas oligotropha]SEN87857.1 hypothetical protein SAMN05216333_1024 [Nitrosomonas oligotropha]